MKTIRVKYFDEEDQAVCNYQFTYPQEQELLEIFPEAREIIQFKIQAWARAKGKLICKETIPYLKMCNALKDPFAQAFWKEVYLVMAGRFNECLRQLARLRRLEAMLTAPDNFKGWTAKIREAKERPITELYDFQRLRNSSNGYTCLCPLHPDKNPSFHIWKDSNSWFCWGCNCGGDSIKFAMCLHKMKFHEAVNYLVGGVR